MDKKFVITEKINIILKSKMCTVYKLSKLAGVDDSALYQMVKGDIPFSEDYRDKVLPILEVPKEEFESWIVADKYPKEIIERAIQVRKDFPYKRKRILTTKIDALLDERGLSRKAFAEQVINYEQSSFNQIVVGKRNMSPAVREKVSVALEIPQEEILAWIMADRHGLAVLEQALKEIIEGEI